VDSTITNPDQALSTSSIPTSIASTASPVAQPLPSGLPNLIIADNTMPPLPQGQTQISILLDSALSWQWVATTPKSSAQILAYMPAILMNGLQLQRKPLSLVSACGSWLTFWCSKPSDCCCAEGLRAG
jgi:hypothetical protein